MYHSLLDYSMVGGYLYCFQFGAIINNAAVNIDHRPSSRHMYSFPLGRLLRVELLG